MNTDESSPQRIVELDRLVAGLPAEERQRFERIFLVSRTVGRLRIPPAMRDWVLNHFGSLEEVQEQTIVRVTNRITLEGTLFNPLRARRPMPADPAQLEEDIRAAEGDAFCDPENQTPADVFGRVRGTHALTAGNLAKCDALHGVVVFSEHHPLRFSEEQVIDYFDVALRWAKEAHNADRGARYFFFLWNCLWKAGSSMIHGHAQVTLTRDMHYPKVEHWRRCAQLYRLGHGSSYFDDLTAVHRTLGLAYEMPGAAILAHLTPIKEKEMLIIGERPDIPFRQAVYRALEALVRRLDAQSFSLAMYWRPIDGVSEDWEGFPTIVRVVDRGPLYTRTADIGSMELYAVSAVSSDPFDVARALRDEPARKLAGRQPSCGGQTRVTALKRS